MIERALTPEQSDADTLSQKRNAVRDAALKLLPSDQSVNVAKETERQRFRENIRGARGFLKDLFSYQTGLYSAAFEDSKSASDFNSLIQSSDIARAIDAWSQAYRNIQFRPRHSYEFTQRCRLTIAVPRQVPRWPVRNRGAPESPEQATIGAQKTFVDDIKTEIAYQAAELLGKGGAISCSEIREVKTLVKSQTTRERALKAACYCRDNSKNGLGDYLVRTPKISRYNADPNKPNNRHRNGFWDLKQPPTRGPRAILVIWISSRLPQKHLQMQWIMLPRPSTHFLLRESLKLPRLVRQ